MLAESAETQGKNNVAFLSKFLVNDLEGCLDLLINTKRLPEATFFARTYLPNRTSETLKLWKEHIGTISEKASQSLADPAEYPNLFPDFKPGMSTQEEEKDETEHMDDHDEYKGKSKPEDDEVRFGGSWNLSTNIKIESLFL